MKKGWMYLLVLMLFCSISFGASASKLEERMEKIIYEKELDFKNVPLSDVLSVISKTSGISIVSEGAVATTNIDLYFGRGQSLADIIKTIKTTHNLNSKELNNVLVLGKEIKDDVDAKAKIIGKVVSARTGDGLQGVKVYLIGDEKEEIKSEVGGNFIIENVTPGTYIIKAESDMYEDNGSIVELSEGQVLTQNLSMKLSKKAADMISQEKEKGVRLQNNTSNLGSVVNEEGNKELTERIKLRHTIASEIKAVVDSVLPDVEVTAVENQHMLVIKGSDENIDIARKLIDELDVPVKQVRITAQILEVSGNLTEELGIDWSFNSYDNATAANGEGLLASITSGIGKLKFTDYLSGASDIIDATLNILEQTSDANLAAIPSIVALNGETAEISVNTEQNVGVTEKTNEEGDTVREPTFKEAGTVLSITPLIRDGEGDEKDTITLIVNTELSSFLQESITGEDQYLGASQKNLASTRVRVEDGGVIFIGGLQRTETTNTEDKVPFLGDIPFLGRLFKHEKVTTKKKDIYIQIKAEIVTDENRNNDISTEGFRVEEVNLNQRLFR